MDVGLHDHREQRRSIRRRGSSRDGKNDPARSLGICSSTSPAVVVSVRGREPLRWVVRLSVRSCGCAPIAAVASASISSWYIVSAACRIRSSTSAAFEHLQHLKQGRLV